MPQATGNADAWPRSRELASALAAYNHGWENPVDEELELWLAGALVVVAGQQPGLWGGPLLSLVKACAVAAEVARLRAEGKQAVGFFWLETRDDDLPEMGWGRVVAGGQVVEAKEPWARGQACACRVSLSPRSLSVLDSLLEKSLPPQAQEALVLARECFSPGALLGNACGRFFATLLRGMGVVLVDSRMPELARASAWAAQVLLSRLQEAHELLESRAQALTAQGLALPLRLSKERLPFFWFGRDRRHRVTVREAPLLASTLERAPEQVAPNVWLRPLLQDAALGTTTAILGSAELAYHWQAQDLWPLVGLRRPAWKLRPHITVVGPAERRWARQLNLMPEELLSPRLPSRLLRVSRLRQQLERLAAQWLEDFKSFAAHGRKELPNLTGDLEASHKRLVATLDWLARRVETRAAERLTVEQQRFFRLRQSIRPLGRPQERALSALSPLLALGLAFPLHLRLALGQLPWEGMHLLYWREGGLW